MSERSVRTGERARSVPRRNRRSYLKYKEAARALVHVRLAHFNQHYGYAWGRISIKNHKSRWGSCSKKGNLNFSYRIVYLPAEVADYVIIHELCHLGEFNHSPRFWALVARACPEHRSLRAQLRN